MSVITDLIARVIDLRRTSYAESSEDCICDVAQSLTIARSEPEAWDRIYSKNQKQVENVCKT